MIDISKYKIYLFDYLINHHNIVNPKKFFHCLNPNHIDNNPSMIFTDKYNICKCFSCGAHYDIFDLVGMDFNISNFKDKIKKVSELYGEHDLKHMKKSKKVYFPKINYTNYYNRCIQNINKSDYLEKRGIDNYLINKYHIGYDCNRKLVIFPINKNCYFARSTISSDKIKSRGNSDVWNKQLLDNPTDIIYVTEGIIDSLSLETVNPNIKTVSINGIGNSNSFYHLVKEKDFKGILVIAFDNDYPGIDAGKKLEKKLNEIDGVIAFFNPLIRNFGDDCKDLNQALLLDRSKLKRNLEYFNMAYLTIAEKQKEGYEVFGR